MYCIIISLAELTHEHQNYLYGLVMNPHSEAHLQAIYATHLFRHLVPPKVPSGEYIINSTEDSEGLRTCPCNCGSKLNLGYTGFGKSVFSKWQWMEMKFNVNIGVND